MKIVRYQHQNTVAFGSLLEDGRIDVLSGSPYEGEVRPTGTKLALADVKLLAPTAHPHIRIFGVGYNYVSHIKEVGAESPPLPALFVKPTSALAGPDDAVVYPRVGQNVHYESELVVVMGRRARRVSEADALNHVLGYTCGNDFSERVIQRQEMKFGCLFAAKGFETFAPIGPAINTALDPSNLEIIGRLNGVEKQRGHTSDLLFSVPKLIAYLSDITPLEPGDLIMTGTPSGVGPVKPGDRFEVEIPGIGVLANTIIADPEK